MLVGIDVASTPSLPSRVGVKDQPQGGKQLLWIGLWFIWSLLSPTAGVAEKLLYTYTDQKGQLVVTDRWEAVPPQSRDRVTVMNDGQPGASAPITRSEPPSRPLSFPAQKTIDSVVQRTLDLLPETIIPGLTAYQSLVMVVGCLAMILLYALARLTGSQFLSLLLPWGLGFLMLGTVYAMFIASDGIKRAGSTQRSGSLVDLYTTQGQKIQTLHEDRARQIDQASSPQ
jgi:hypothetical protein